MFAPDIPPIAKQAINLLEEAGYEAWLVGGFVRDALLNRPFTGDIDIATSAHPDQSSTLFRAQGHSVFETGIKHGTITVVIDQTPLEITTYRSEGTYRDHRHPDSVTFVRSIEDDLSRRDFTINAMAYHPTRGLVDPYGGQTDCQTQIIRCVGVPSVRFEEDALRVLRALRFASQLGFNIEDATSQAIFQYAPDLVRVSPQRLFAELDKLLCGIAVHATIMRYVDALAAVLPELIPMKGLDQKTRYHIYDVLEHTVYVIENIPPYSLGRWAALFHDMGKPDTFFVDEHGAGHMHGHPEVSVEHLYRVADRLRFPKKMTHDLELLVRYHDTRPTATEKSVRKLYTRMEERDDLMRVMFDLMRADALSQAPFCHKRVGLTNEVEQLYLTMRRNAGLFSPDDLPINGDDLIALGLAEGPEIGKALDILFHAVLNDEVALNREALLERARRLADKWNA